jgi:hypothetical protein
MREGRRAIVGIAILLAGGAIASMFGGGGVGTCLGPLGVTEVQCAQKTGMVPNVGLGMPGLAASVTLALIVLVPVRRGDRAQAVVASAAGAMAAGLLYLALTPRTLEGFDSRGQWLTVGRPLDAWAVATAFMVGAATGYVAAAMLARRVRRPGR